MKCKQILLIAAVVVVAILAQALRAQNNKAVSQKPPLANSPALTVEQIVNKTNYIAYYQGSDGRAKVKMTVIDKQKQKREKELIILRWDEPAPEAKSRDDGNEDSKTAVERKAAADVADERNCGRQRFYVYFLRPPDDNKTTFLVWKHLDKDDDRWLYLPNLDLVKRIAATDKRISFVGSHFFYEDISGRNTNADKHELLKTTRNYYVLRNTPKDPESVEFAYYDMYILRDTFVTAHIYYYDKNGRKYRTYSVLKWDRDKAHAYATVRRARIDDEKIGGYTILDYEDVEYNINLPKTLFTERFLKRTPYRYLK